MKLNKQQLIEQYLNEPITHNNYVKVNGIKNEQFKVHDIIDGKVLIHRDDLKLQHKNSKSKSKKPVEYEQYYPISECQKVTHISDICNMGENPNIEKHYLRNTYSYGACIENLLYSVGFDRKIKVFKNAIIGIVEIPEMTLNPFVVDKNGKKIYYQRGLVWSLKRKQELINSIYNGVDIGKISIRKRTWEYVEAKVKSNEIEDLAFRDAVDGKQRINAILEFVENKFQDNHGNYFDDLSNNAQCDFNTKMILTISELNENSTDADVIESFLNINIAGVKQDDKHIEFVKSIEL